MQTLDTIKLLNLCKSYRVKKATYHYFMFLLFNYEWAWASFQCLLAIYISFHVNWLFLALAHVLLFLFGCSSVSHWFMELFVYKGTWLLVICVTNNFPNLTFNFVYIFFCPAVLNYIVKVIIPFLYGFRIWRSMLQRFF